MEVGDINEDASPFTKFQKLLSEYPKVIHIFSDKDFFLLHSIMYSKKSIIPKKLTEVIIEQSKILKDIIEDNDLKK